MSKRPGFDEFKKRVLQDPEAKAAYDLLEPEFALLAQFIKARKKAPRSSLSPKKSSVSKSKKTC